MPMNKHNEVFYSYYRRGFPKLRETSIGDIIFHGTMPLDDAIMESLKRRNPKVEKRMFEEGAIILSGGNMVWRVPKGLEEVAVTADQKISYLLRKKGLRINAELAPNPLTSV